MELLNDEIKTKIYSIRDTKVMLDSDLAKLYQVETKYLNRQVKRNIERFDEKCFMFQLTKEELENLRCQIVTFKENLNTKYLPYVFTEQGVYMLATVLNSKVAVDVTKNIMKTFTKMREFTLNYKDVVIELQNIKKS